MLVAHVLQLSRRPYVMLPVMLIFVSIVSKMLLSRAVTYESQDDILGSHDWYNFVAVQGIWGEWWRTQFIAIGLDTVDFIERRVRYCALYSTPLICFAMAFLLITRGYYEIDQKSHSRCLPGRTHCFRFYLAKRQHYVDMGFNRQSNRTRRRSRTAQYSAPIVSTWRHDCSRMQRGGVVTRLAFGRQGFGDCGFGGGGSDKLVAIWKNRGRFYRSFPTSSKCRHNDLTLRQLRVSFLSIGVEHALPGSGKS